MDWGGGGPCKAVRPRCTIEALLKDAQEVSNWAYCLLNGALPPRKAYFLEARDLGTYYAKCIMYIMHYILYVHNIMSHVI